MKGNRRSRSVALLLTCVMLLGCAASGCAGSAAARNPAPAASAER